MTNRAATDEETVVELAMASWEQAAGQSFGGMADALCLTDVKPVELAAEFIGGSGAVAYDYVAYWSILDTRPVKCTCGAVGVHQTCITWKEAVAS